MARPPVLRAGQILLGALLIAGAGALAFAVVPQSLGPQAGQEHAVTEAIRYWTPEDGWQEATRTDHVQVTEAGQALRFEQTVDGPHSPRGDSFAFTIQEDYELADEQGLRASFPPTPYLRDPPSRVYLAVPWELEDGAFAGAHDNLTLVETTERQGTELLVYEAYHGRQFFHPEDGLTWYRAVERTVLVEPLTGTIVDHDTHEVLWKETYPTVEGLPIPWAIQKPLLEREKVWEAHVSVTPESQADRLETAEDRRDGYHWQMIAAGLPTLLLGEVLIWRGAVGGWTKGKG